MIINNYSNVLLISTNMVKTNTIISSNVDDKILENIIRTQQIIDLQNVIGTALYEKLQALVGTGEIKEDINKNYKYLLDAYIIDLLSASATKEAFIELTYKLRNIGAVTINNETSTAPTLNDLNYLKKHYDDKVDFFKGRITDFLIANTNSYPEFLTIRDVSDMASISDNTSGSGIFLGSSDDIKNKYNYKGK